MSSPRSDRSRRRDAIDELDAAMRGVRPGAPVTLEPSPRSPAQRWLVCDGRRMVELGTAELERLELHEPAGAGWSDELAERLRRVLRQRAADRDARRLLARRALSRQELLDRLVGRGHDDDVATEAVDVLCAGRAIDDELIVERHCRAARRSSDVGPGLLEQRLRARRLDEERVREAVDATYDEVDLVEQAVAFANARLASTRGDRLDRIRRVGGALARRGFDEDTVREALRRLDLDPDDPSR